jgi:eukaryotic-like serine/threonine-protein kinase
VITLSLLHPIKQVPVQVWTFQNETTIRIGRSTDNQVILYSAVVSRHHVELRKLGNGWEIVNLGTNGTYLDGKRITQVIATDGAVIRLARSGPNLQIRFGEAALNSMSRLLDPEKTTGQRRELTNTPTEVTDYGVNESAKSASESEPIAPEATSTRALGTIPVPDHLSLSFVEPAETIVDLSSDVAARCKHLRAQSLFCPDCGVPTHSNH